MIDVVMDDDNRTSDCDADDEATGRPWRWTDYRA
jgi:hypothetical protein